MIIADGRIGEVRTCWPAYEAPYEICRFVSHGHSATADTSSASLTRPAVWPFSGAGGASRDPAVDKHIWSPPCPQDALTATPHASLPPVAQRLAPPRGSATTIGPREAASDPS